MAQNIGIKQKITKLWFLTIFCMIFWLESIGNGSFNKKKKKNDDFKDFMKIDFLLWLYFSVGINGKWSIQYEKILIEFLPWDFIFTGNIGTNDQFL